MINLEEIRQYFVDTIIASGIFADNGMDWENVVRKNNNPRNKSLWMKESYLNVDEGFSDSINGDQLQGILSYSINVPIGSYAQTATEAGVALGNLFPTASTITTDDYHISIDATKRSFQGKLSNDSKWYTVVIDVHFKAYEADVIIPQAYFTLDATKGVEFSSGELAERWNDANYNGLFVRQNTGENQPTNDGVKTTFNGTQYMEGAPLDVEGDVSVVIKFQSDATPNYGRLLWNKTTGTSSNGFYVAMGATKSKLEIRGGGTAFFPAVDIVDFSASVNVLTVVFKGSTVSVYINGVFHSSSAIGEIQQSSVNLFVGSENDGGQNFDGDIYNNIIYNEALSQSQITAITEALA